MSWIDWAIALVPLLVTAFIGWRARHHVQAVSDFLAGGRVAGRYVVAVASGEAAMGLISVVAMFELYYKSGFAIGFWGGFAMPVGLLVTLTGFAIYRYRETRAMTMAQFFEIRYSRRFRVFAGMLAWVAGVINYALFPAVGGRFIVHYAGLPPSVSLLGLQISTFGLVMAIFLTLAVLIVLAGGQLTTMVTDCVAGLFSYAMYAVVVAAVLMLFSWTQMKETLLSRPPGESMLNPFDTGKLQDFNILFIIVGIVSSVYNLLSWQGTQGYNAAAISPHEQKMGRVLGTWRAGFSLLMFVLLAMAAYTYLNHPDFQEDARQVASDIQHIQLDTTQATQTIQNQMRVPMAISHFLPVGITGAFFALMLFLLISTDTTYLHSWGSIFVQDVILPLRKRPFTPTQQIWLLRLSILSVAIFAFFFSLLFNQVTYILMFFALTGSIYLGGAGVVILGGLYWKRGTAAGAWTAMLVGATLGIMGFVLTQYWANPIYPYLDQHWPGLLAWMASVLHSLGQVLPFVYWEVGPEKFPITGQEIYLLTILLAIGSYVTVSLLTCREPFNLARMLHRGPYRRPEDRSKRVPDADRPLSNWKRILLGFDENFTTGDKILSTSVFIYSMTMFTIFLGVIGWNLLIGRWSNETWASYFWWMNIAMVLVIGSVTSVWFTIGGIRDLRKMFRRLAAAERNVLDDGRVVDHLNVDDLVSLPTAQPAAEHEGAQQVKDSRSGAAGTAQTAIRS